MQSQGVFNHHIINIYTTPVPSLILEALNTEFVENVLTTAEDASFDAKIEASFFIATIIVCRGSDKIEHLFYTRVFSLVSGV